MRIRALSASFAVLAASLVGVGLGAAPAEAAAPSNDLIADATPISGESGTVAGTTTGATLSVGEPKGVDDRPANPDPTFTGSVWYRITTPDDVGLRFSIPKPRSGISIGTYVSYNGAEPSQVFDNYESNGWAPELSPGVYGSVAAVAGTFVQNDPDISAVYYVRVTTTAAGAGDFTLDWAEGGLDTTTTATVTTNHAAGTFRINPSTTCVRSFYSGEAPTPVDPADYGYYIVRDESGTPVGSKRRWDFSTSDGTTPAVITNLPLVPGSHTYTVRFYEGTSYLYCNRSETTVTVVDAQPTATKLKVVVSKQKVTFTGSVTPAPPAGAGIQVLEKGDSVTGLVLKNGAGKAVLTGVKPGKHTYTGLFDSPFPAFANSSAKPVTITVPKYTTTTSLSAPKTAKAGARPIVTVRVLVGTKLAAGSVVVRVNGTTVTTIKLVKGRAAVKLPTLKSGKATVTVTYVSTSVNGSSKATKVVTVTKK
ncbi:MAG: hypothetical protein JWQ74_1089 [Marmoricola sp.]|nr:hypothetical protein [Marmoricola sp.]